MIAAAYLCKQSFVFLAPLSVLLLGDWREKKYWLTIALPAAGYSAYLLATGAFPEAVLQLTSQSGIVSTGIGSYLNYGTLLGVLAGYGSMFLLGASTVPLLGRGRVSTYIGASTLVVMPAFFAAAGLYRGSLGVVSFGIFGMVLGAVMHRVSTWRARDADEVPVVSVALLLAWSASLSVGYNFPALLLGPLFTVLVAFVYSVRGSLDPRFLRTALAVAGVAILLGSA